MKKFTKLLICLMLCVVSFGLVACDNRTEKEKNFTYPSYDADVLSNGGLAVEKGNYIYFVNGYQSVQNISNKNASYTVGSLMLMKLGENGEVVTDEDGLLKDEYYITMSSALCGYEATNLYIFGDYLYFVTPCLENESGDKVWAKERVIFNRIKLDKTGKVEEVYSSGVKFDQLKFEYYEENGSLYILAWEQGDSYYGNTGNNTLVRINATNKSSNVITTKVSSVVFADNADEIFFVKDDSENSKYYLKQYNIASDEITDYTSFDKSVTAKFVANGNVYITMSHGVGSSTDVKISNIAQKSGFELFHAFEGSAELNIAPNGAAIVYVTENVINLKTSDKSILTIIDEDATSINIIGFYNGCVVYYDETSNIKMVSYYNKINGGDVEISTLTTIDAVETDYAYFDIADDSAYMYFYKKSGENYYLNRLKVNNNLGDIEEMVGVYLEDDVPEVEEEEVEEEE